MLFPQIANRLAGADCILMYHGTPQRHAARLARQLRAIAFFFDVVPLEELGAMRGRRKGHARKRVALTFDDGLRSNVHVAYPVLRALGLRATFFVCPGLVEHERWLWNHEARQRLFSLPREALAELAAGVGAPQDAAAFVQWMKTLRFGERRCVEEAIRDASPGFRPSPAQREAFDVAGWDELRKLDPSVVTMGSHSLTHPILASLSADEMDAELRESRAALERELGRPAVLFCYPNGDLNDAALHAARRYYRCAVTVEPRSLEADVDPHLLPRLAAEPDRALPLARKLAFA